MPCLVIADHDPFRPAGATAHALRAALALGEGADVWVCAPAERAQHLARLDGVRRVLRVEPDPAGAEPAAMPSAETVAPQLAALAQGYSHVIFAATAWGKDVAPRLAALLDVAMVGDVTRICAADTFERPIYAGSAVATVCALDAVKVLTVRVTAFDAVGPAAAPAPVELLTAGAGAAAAGRRRHLGFEQVRRERPDLVGARVVVAGGRGLGSADQFENLLGPLADRLGAALGASLAAVDAGFAPNDWQVGQSGRVVAPELYIACGISGAVQHVAGMKDAKVIVAINHDPDAPIFEVADYGLVADLFEAVPELTQRLG